MLLELETNQFHHHGDLREGGFWASFLILGEGMRWYGIPIFSGAFLLFLVQPLIARFLTPAFGGSASVWICCLVFFQIMLVLGYAYSHLLVQRLCTNRQGWVHGAIGLAAMALMVVNTIGWGHPLLAGWAIRTQFGRPLLPLLLALLGGVGLPFLWLSATSPLLQSWFVRKFPKREPYRLYALSNAGSLLGLVAFPFILEPNLGSTAHGLIFAVSFAALWTALLGLGQRVGASNNLEATTIPSSPDDVNRPFKPVVVLALSGLGVIFFMALTVHLTAQMGNTPLLWILPLGLYLVSFILPFEGRAWVRGRVFQVTMALLFLFALLMPIPALGMKPLIHAPAWLQIGVLVFSGCTLVHTYLFSFRPSASKLTLFYLYLAIGGSLGGIFVGIITPIIYNKYFEYPVALLLVSIVMIPSLLASRVRKYLAWPAGVLGVCLAVLILINFQSRPGKYFRDFYGTYEVHRITENGHSRLELNNSYTVHGGMDLKEPLRPIAYYGIHSGFGWAMSVARGRHPNLRIGLVGLGAGNSVLYSKKGDQLVVYEISPQVLEIAGRNPISFPFLASSEAKVEIVEGDARIRMQDELSHGGREFDILLVDAFSGGNIPWHLLTSEALRLYQRHLKQDGILVIHVSNNLPLDRVVAATAKGNSMNAIGIYHPSKENPGPLGFGDAYSQYVVLSEKLETLLDGHMMGASSWLVTWKPLDDDLKSMPEMAVRSELGQKVLAGVRPWEDAHCSVFPLLFKDSVFKLMNGPPDLQKTAPR